MNKIQIIKSCYVTLLKFDGKTVACEQGPSEFTYDRIVHSNEHYTILQKTEDGLNNYVFPTVALEMPVLIAWSFEDEDLGELNYSYEIDPIKHPPDYDLCGTFKGKMVDVVKHVNDTWSWFYDGERKQSGIASREDAVTQLTNWLKWNYAIQ